MAYIHKKKSNRNRQLEMKRKERLNRQHNKKMSMIEPNPSDLLENLTGVLNSLHPLFMAYFESISQC